LRKPLISGKAVIKAESSKLKGKAETMGEMKFGYEDLDVWNRAVDFAVKVIDLVETIDTWFW
jgi:hypothetical protein